MGCQPHGPRTRPRSLVGGDRRASLRKASRSNPRARIGRPCQQPRRVFCPDDRGHGERARRRVRGARGAHRTCARSAIRGGGAGHARDRTHRWAFGSSGRPRVTMGGRSTAGRFSGSRDRAAPLAPRSNPHHPQVLADADHAYRPGPGRFGRASRDAVLAVERSWSRQHHRERRRGQREDHDARGPRLGDRRRRATHHDRGRRRAAVGETPRGLTGSETRERRGSRRGHRP